MSQSLDPRSQEGRSVPQLLSDLVRDVSTLLRQESLLIRAELSDKVSQIQVGAGSLIAGAVVLLVSLNVLAAALVVAIAKLGEPDLGGGWAALIVGVVLALIGFILVKKGTSNMTHLTPERTVSQVSKDASFVREQVQ
jgi:hypothetical protein